MLRREKHFAPFHMLNYRENFVAICASPKHLTQQESPAVADKPARRGVM